MPMFSGIGTVGAYPAKVPLQYCWLASRLSLNELVDVLELVGTTLARHRATSLCCVFYTSKGVRDQHKLPPITSVLYSLHLMLCNVGVPTTPPPLMDDGLQSERRTILSDVHSEARGCTTDGSSRLFDYFRAPETSSL
jgi:hypothetical protein